MKTFFTSFILIFACLVSSAQTQHLFDAYRSYGRLYGINVREPEGFRMIDAFAMIQLYEGNRVGTGYEMVLQSECKDCLFLFPMYEALHRHDSLYVNMAYGEVKSALRIDPKKGTEALDTARYVKVVSGVEASRYFNADEVIFYKVPLDSAFIWEPSSLSLAELRTYTTCIGMNMRKEGFPVMLAKILLTEEGKKKEKEYVETFLSCIRYGDKPKKYSKRKEHRVVKRYYRKLGL